MLCSTTAFGVRSQILQIAGANHEFNESHWPIQDFLAVLLFITRPVLENVLTTYLRYRLALSPYSDDLNPSI